jgi:hypothetical protein
VVVQVGAVKIYVVAAEALRKKGGDETQFTTTIGGKTCLGPSQLFALSKNERGDETQFTTKIGGKPSLGPSYPFDALLCP